MILYKSHNLCKLHKSLKISCASATTAKVKWAVRIYDDWRKVRNAEQSDPHMHIPPLLQLTHDCEKLMDTICQMLSEARKKNGEEYPGSTLSDIIAVLPASVFKKQVFFCAFFSSWCFFCCGKVFFCAFFFFKMCFFFLIMLAKVKFCKFSLQFLCFLGIVS